MQFTYEFQKGYQEIYFAHSIPYTYSMLNEYLQKQKVKKQTLCHSLAGNKVEYIHVTGNTAPNKDAADMESISPTKVDKKKKNGNAGGVDAKG